MIQTPILFISDSPSLQSGLARIGRGLACLCAEMPEFRVGYLGRGGIASKQIPIPQYTFPESQGFGDEALIDHVVRDFAGNGNVILFVINDAARNRWLSRGNWIAKRRDKTSLWGYIPVDSHTPNGTLSPIERDALQGYNRILAYGPFGAQVLSATVGQVVDWIPHGISLDKFQPRDKLAARIAMQFDERDKLLGIVMTNQQRKDWGVAIKAFSLLPSEWRLWCHIDVLERHWSLPALIEEYGVGDRVKVTMTGDMTDIELSYAYSAMDVVMIPSSEGFCFPLAEALACGVPCVHSSYGGGNWNLPTVRYVTPSAYRVEGPFNALRPLFDPEVFATAAVGFRPSAEECVASVDHLSWPKLWRGCWKKWFRQGITQ